MDVYARLKELGLELPEAPPAGGKYAPVQCDGNTVYISGCGPQIGQDAMVGKMGMDFTVEQGQMAARRCALNILAVLHRDIGDLNRIDQVLKLLVMIAGTSDFYQQPKVADGATQLLIDLFGKRGEPARSAVGMASLPGNIPVEIEAIVRLKDT